MRVVLDTGIFISALISDQGYPYRAVDLWVEKEFDLVTSERQLDEIRTVSRYARIAPLVIPHQVGTLVNRMKKYATVLEELPEVTYSPDPDDNPILAAALAGGANYVVSGDKGHLLALVSVEGIPVVTARAFVELFRPSGH